jgi:hypothetical protein
MVMKRSMLSREHQPIKPSNQGTHQQGPTDMDTIISSSASPRRHRPRTLPSSIAVKASTHPRAATPSASSPTSSRTSATPSDTAPSIASQVLDRASRMHRDLDQILELMGWNTVPAELITDILDDISAFADELKGAYSTVCPYVIRRRQSIDFWIRSVMEGACSVGTAREALRVTRLGSPA